MKCRKCLLCLVALLSFGLASCQTVRDTDVSNDSHAGGTGASSATIGETSCSKSEWPNPPRYSFKEMANLLADTASASALGVLNRAGGESKKKLNNAKNSENTTSGPKLIKTSSFYDSLEPTANADGTLDVRFLKTVITETQEEVTITKNVMAYVSDYEIKILADDRNGILVNGEEEREFKVTVGQLLLVDWTSGIKTSFDDGGQTKTGTRLSFDNNYDASQLTIETRKTNVSYAFSALEGDRYTLTDTETIEVLYDDVVDNDERDLNTSKGVIELGGLKEGVIYELKQRGIRYSETVAQDEVDGKIDKLFVDGDYSFLSFVPKDASEDNARPADEKLTYDENNISIYDTTDYFTNDARQSFVVNNRTGKIYSLNGYTISKIYKSFVKMEDGLIYSYGVSSDDSLIFTPVFTNTSIVAAYPFEDKYGNKFILNDKIDAYDSKTNTHFFTNQYDSAWFNYKTDNPVFYKTKSNEVIAVNLKFSDASTRKASAYSIFSGANETRNLSETDCFDFEYIDGLDYQCEKIENGIGGFYSSNCEKFFNNVGAYKFFEVETDGDIHSAWCNGWIDGVGTYTSEALLDDDILLVFYKDKNVYYIADFYTTFLPRFGDLEGFSGFGLDQSAGNDPASYGYTLLLENCEIVNGKPCQYGLNGNTYYDIVAKAGEDGEIHPVPYVEGTYVAPCVSELEKILQPIN